MGGSCNTCGGRGNVSDSIATVLKGIKLFSDLSPEQLSEIGEYCLYKRFAPNEQIFDRQSETRDVYFVVRGRVRIVNFSLSGREVTLDELPEGSHFGELAALDGKPRSAGVMALTNSLIVALPYKHFIRALEKYPPLALKVIRDLTRMVRTSTDRIMDLSTLGANNRVHAELLRQARAGREDEEDAGDNTATISPVPLHGDMASRVSTTRETVARVMNDLARQGVVERTKDSLVIRDVRRLRQMVEEVRGE